MSATVWQTAVKPPNDGEKKAVDAITIQQDMPGAGRCPKETARLPSKSVFNWINPLFKKGWREPLTMNDLWEVPRDVQSDLMADKFEKEWNQQLAIFNAARDAKKKSAKKGESIDDKRVIDGLILRGVLWTFFRREVLPLATLDIAFQLSNVFSPYLLQYIVEYADNRGTPQAQSLSTGVGYSIGLFCLQMFGTLIFNHFQQNVQIKSISIKTMVTCGIYRKVTKLSPQARASFGAGQITNMVASDTMRIQMFLPQAILVFVVPWILVGCIVFLLISIGWAALIGLCLLVLAIPLQTFLFSKMKVIRARQAPITDQRVKKTSEILNGVRVIKLFAWEESFLKVVDDIRRLELEQVLTRSVYQAIVMTQGQTIPALCTCVSFIAYGLLNPLNPAKVFSSMAWFNQLRMPLWMIPNILNTWAEFNVALTRIESLLLATEIDENYATSLNSDSEHAVVVENGEFSWNGPIYADDTLPPLPPPKDKKESPGGQRGPRGLGGSGGPDSSPKFLEERKFAPSTESYLKNINISIPKGSLTAIVGSVGSGKSSLLNAIIGEMRKVAGSVAISSDIAYAAQSAWIQNATMKENIIFGQSFDNERYLESLYNAALLPDLRILPDRDQTSIGERGINLSGGQKQRINIARLLYNPSQIVLMDDPLSAVDAHVGRHLFEKCILGALKNRTRILVTHQLHFLSRCDNIIFMKDGRVHEVGSYANLMANDAEFSTMMTTFGGVEKEEGNSSDDDSVETKQDFENDIKELDELTSPKVNAKDIMTQEDRTTGGVKPEVWWRYILACGGISFCVWSIFFIVLNEGSSVVNNLWLTWWTGTDIKNFSNDDYTYVYLALAIINASTTFFYAFFFAHVGTRASKIMHDKALQRILCCPIYFFDTTPVGRIINRFSSDVDALDNTVTASVRQLASSASSTISTFIVMVVALPVLLAVIVPCMGIYWFVQDVYRRTARELKRLSSIARSPWFNNFGETLIGISTIRAYRDQKRFILKNDIAMDVSNSPNYYLTTAGNWLAIRLQLVGSCIVLAAALLGITSNVLSPNLFGLCLTYSLSITQTLSMMVQDFTACEIAMNSAERVEHYAYRIDTEPDVGQAKPAKEWPSKGVIEFRNVSFQYAKSLPVVLNDISFATRDNEKIGIVGRTGSGKSSLMQALFRIAESNGLISVDSVDTKSVSLKSLRSSLAIIPQDPVVFSGTFRFNMDPLGEYRDAELWSALDRAGLKRKVEVQEGKLDGFVESGGENLSIGERQLLCLSRAMLKRPKILIMDEATANVDYETDAKIQKALREDFKETTILTIAHRLVTIMDYDRVLVLDHGKLAEFDTPKALLEREGIFYSLVMQTGESNATVLKKMAN